MTTTVRILIEGNKACEVYVSEPEGQPQLPDTVKPGEFATKYIHGEQKLVVKEVGDFLD